MEGKEILGEFERWVRKKANFDIVNNNNNNNKNKYSESIVIDFANDRNICRFTLWKDLICMLEIMDAETGRYKLNQRDEFLTYFQQCIINFRERHSD
ncbi:immunity protein TriTu family protein [Cronobacter malonaticus]